MTKVLGLLLIVLGGVVALTVFMGTKPLICALGLVLICIGIRNVVIEF